MSLWLHILWHCGKRSISTVRFCDNILDKRASHYGSTRGSNQRERRSRRCVHRGLKMQSRHVHGGSCGRVLSLKTLETRTPTPSNTLSRIPHATADPRAERGPPGREVNFIYCASHKCAGRYYDKHEDGYLLRAARHPPVRNPEMIAFHISSF